MEPFYKSIVQAEVGSIMESYNPVNNVFMTQNEELLQKTLKDKFGFKGFIMSDWYAINSDAPTHFSTGCDMNMPGGPYQTKEKTGIDGSYWSKLPIWLENGDVTQKELMMLL